MIRVAVACVAFAFPAIAEEAKAPVSDAGTAFMRLCLEDVTEARIALLKKRAPDFAASMSDEQLEAGGRSKAVRACPCFLHMIGISPAAEGATPEEKVADIVRYLGIVRAGDAASLPPALATAPRNCGERSSVLPPRWYGQ